MPLISVQVISRTDFWAGLSALQSSSPVLPAASVPVFVAASTDPLAPTPKSTAASASVIPVPTSRERRLDAGRARPVGSIWPGLSAMDGPPLGCADSLD